MHQICDFYLINSAKNATNCEVQYLKTPINFRCSCACWHVLLCAQRHLENSEAAAVVALVADGAREAAEVPQKV